MKLWRHPETKSFYVVWQEHGRSQRKSTRTKKRVEAEKILRRFQREKLDPLDHSLTVADAAERWLREREPDGLRPCQPQTYRDYRLAVDRLVALLGSRAAASVTPRMIRHALEELRKQGLSQPSRAKWLRFIRMIFGELHREGEIRLNPVLAVPKPRVEESRHEVLTAERFDALLGEVRGSGPQGLADALEILWLTGLRSVELIRLAWEDIDLDRALWTIRSPQNKGGVSERPIPRRVCEILKARRGLPRGPFGPGLRIAWARWKARNPAWTGLSLHSLRHAFVTRLARSGNAAAASFLVGHHSEAMTRHYTHLTAEDVRHLLD
jgi:integrase